MADLETAALPATRPAGPVGSVGMGIMPTTLDDGWRLAQILAKSNLVPDDFRNKPENVLVALQLGAEVGFPPMQALQSIAVINGRPSIWGDGFLALLVSSSKYRTHEEYFEVKGDRRDGLTGDDWKHDDTAAVCVFWRTDRQQPTTVRFTVGQAKKSGLLSKQGPWQTYPDRMLRMRARSWAGRDAFPDVLRGLKTAEEVVDTDVVVDVPPPVEPRRASARPTPVAVDPDPTPTEQPGQPPAATPVDAKVAGVARALRITATQYVKPEEGAPYFLIATTGPTGPLDFVTRDETIYKAAAAREGSDDQVAIAYHDQPKAGPKPQTVHVIQRLDPWPPESTDADLFTT